MTVFNDPLKIREFTYEAAAVEIDRRDLSGEATLLKSFVKDLQADMQALKGADALFAEKADELHELFSVLERQEIAGVAQAQVAIVELNGTPVGFSYAKILKSDENPRICRLEAIWVDEACRGIGAGTVLFNAAKTWAAKNKAKRLDSHTLVGMRETKNFFERHGVTTRKLVVSTEL